MKKQLLFYLLATFILASCGSIYVEYDYDEKASFNNYKTYNYDFGEGTGLSEFDDRRFIKYTDSVLQLKGLILSDNPDLWVTLVSEEYETQSRNTLGVGLGGGGGNVGVGVSGGIPIGGRELHQNIQVSMINSTSNTVVWEAISDSDVKLKSNPAQRDAYFQKLAAKIFKKYPPEQ